MDKVGEWLPKYASAKERLRTLNQLWMQLLIGVSSQTFDEVKAKCDQAGVPVSSIYSIKDCFEDPQYQYRNDILDIPVRNLVL